MKRVKNLLIIIFYLSLAGCQSVVNRGPSSISTAQNFENLKILKQRKTELDALSIHFQNNKNIYQLSKIKDEQQDLESKIQEIEGSDFL